MASTVALGQLSAWHAQVKRAYHINYPSVAVVVFVIVCDVAGGGL